jgi:amino acid adenylation domain-containing protein
LLVDHLLRTTAERTPAAQALVCGSTRLTYAELDEATDRVASGLRGLGVARGDRVLIYLENGVEAVLSILGALRAGAVFVPINATTKAEKLAYIVRDCEPAALISDRKGHQTITAALATLDRAPHVVIAAADPADSTSVACTAFEQLASAPTAAREDDRIDLDLAALIYTSGSTGRPKGVMLTHLNIVAATTSINGYLKNTADDVILDVLPLSFDYGLYQLFLAFQVGASVVLERSFAYPTMLLGLIARERVTALPIVPMIAALLLRHDLSAWDLTTLRYITNTGAVLPPPHIAELRGRLPQVRIFSMYGLTECKRVAYLDPEELDRRPTSVGKAMDNVEVFLVDDAGTRLDRGVGELVIRGSNVMQGYWRAPEETARALRPGTLHGELVLYSGDIFRIDDEGFMYFQHRLDDVIKSRGQKVSPREIEDVLHGARGIVEVMVVGVPDQVVGEAVEAFVTIERGATPPSEQELLLYCSRQLEDFMVPRAVHVVDELPHNGAGKRTRRGLRTAIAN